MHRRHFLTRSAALGLFPWLGSARAAESGAISPGGAWRMFEITTAVNIPERGAGLTAWVPLPAVHAAAWNIPRGSHWTGNAHSMTAHSMGRFGGSALRATWRDATENPWLRVASRVLTRDRTVDLARPGRAAPLSAREHALYTGATALLPTDGIVRETAEKIVAGRTTDLGRAVALYEWVVANTFRTAATRGCGLGDIATMLKTGFLGGKCADINALFVGLARSLGIPAREIYGLRAAPSRIGYAALGTKSEVVTGAQHCRAEVYLEGLGWVPADPADVRKVVLEEAPGGLEITDPKVETARRTLFGAWEGNWIGYNTAHDVTLPGSRGPAVPFLMYPEAETVSGRRDCLSPTTFAYTITAREIAI